jgi:uroporphyrinogen-III synthase
MALTENFAGLRVLTLESRRGLEMCRLIENYGGIPTLASAMREIPLASQHEALQFVSDLLQGKFDAVIFLTGVGARALLDVARTEHAEEKFLAALRKVKIIARGPKPAAVLREWQVPIAHIAPEPSTWRELLTTLDSAGEDLRGLRIAVQEYGASNPELFAGLKERGASVVRVPVYQWALPEDTAPLLGAVNAVIDGRIDVALFTTGVQARHLFEVARHQSIQEELRNAFSRVVIASIGPSTSEVLQNLSLTADLEATHPKMGYLVKEAAELAGNLLRGKRGQLAAE